MNLITAFLIPQLIAMLEKLVEVEGPVALEFLKQELLKLEGKLSSTGTTLGPKG